MDTKTDCNLNNIIATLSLIPISSVKKNSPANVLKFDFNSARWMPKLVSIDAQSYAALQPECYLTASLRKQPSFFAPRSSGETPRGPGAKNDGCFRRLPHSRNVTLQTSLSTARDFFRLHSTFARLYNAAASPAARLRLAGSLAINLARQNMLSMLFLHYGGQDCLFEITLSTSMQLFSAVAGTSSQRKI